MKQRRAVVIAWLVSAFCTSGAFAQPAATGTCPDAEALDNLRERRPTALDEAVIDEWINAALSTLKADAVPTATNPSTAVDRFVGCFATQYDDSRNSVAFKVMFAERAGAIFLPEYQKRNTLSVPVAQALARVLLGIKAVPVRETALTGLTFPDQMVRYLSARTLAGIKEGIGADARLTGVTLEAIGQVAANEVNSVIVAAEYEAVSYPDHAGDSVKAILAIVDGRLARMRGTGQVLDRAELVAMRFLDSLTLSNEQKVEVVRRLAPLLRIHTLRFATSGIGEEEKAAIEETIDEVEALLRKLVAPANGPSVSEKMQKGGDAASIDMQIELNLWIGTEQDEGLLNRAPWNVPRGAP